MESQKLLGCLTDDDLTNMNLKLLGCLTDDDLEIMNLKLLGCLMMTWQT